MRRRTTLTFVTIHSTEEIDGVRFFTMELVEGRTLNALIPADGLPLRRFIELALTREGLIARVGLVMSLMSAERHDEAAAGVLRLAVDTTVFCSDDRNCSGYRNTVSSFLCGSRCVIAAPRRP